MLPSVDFKYLFAPSVAYTGESPGEKGESSSCHITTLRSEQQTSQGLELLNQSIDGSTSSPLTASLSLHSVDTTLNSSSSVAKPRLLIDYLGRNKALYDFCVWTAIIYPVPNEGSKREGEYSAAELVLRQRWVRLAHLSVLAYFVLFVFNTVFVLGVYVVAMNERILITMQYVSGIIPLLFLVPAMMCLRANLYREIPPVYTSADCQETVDRVYREACWYAASIGNTLLYVFYSIGFMQLVVQAVFTGIKVRPTITFRVLLMIDVILTLLSHIPPVGMIVGIFTLLVIEQRVSYSFMINLRSKALSGELTDSLYVETGRNFDKRDQHSPINYVLFAAVVNTLICICVMFLLSFTPAYDSTEVLYNVLYMVVVFGNEIVLLMLILIEVLRVNEMVDILLEQTSRQLLSGLSTGGESEFPKDERRIRRLELYLIMKEYRIGSRILFYRPTKVEIIVQITSIAIALATSILKSVVKIITG